jgi:hypothetical protein
MELSDGTNTISDVRFAAAYEDMRERQRADYEMVHDGSGRSEEMPSQLRARQDQERRQLFDDRKNLGIAEWLKIYPDTAQVARMTDREIVHALWAAAQKPLDEAEQAELRQTQVLRPRLRM